VYEARDSRLGRTVAIKVLPEGLAEHAERRARFEREARLVSQLSHPHVCTVHDVGDEGGIHYLVMERLEGETLAARLDRGPLSLEETLRYGAQIAEALAAAHRQGVVHRDLKPANVMVIASGVKLLDFGLARLAAGGSGSMGDLPTMTMEAGRSLTEEGTVLGTFPYMSPEQVEGGEADARSDIFALGAVLYEMVTGRRAFGGKSAASIMAAVLREDPAPVSELRPVSPPALDHVVAGCLAKDPEARWQSARDVATNLRWIGEAGSQAGVAAPVARRRKGRERLAWILAAAALVAAAVAVGWAIFEVRDLPLATERITFLVPPPEGAEFFEEVNSNSLALSPDGTTLALTVEREGESMIVLRRLGESTLRPLPGTEGAESPFWSPDGAFLGFFADEALQKIPAGGGPAQIVCRVQGHNTGAWAPGGTIVFTQALTEHGGLFRVAATGGEPTPMATNDPDLAGGWPRYPVVLPDGRRVLFHRFHRPSETNVLAVADLETGEARVLFPLMSRAAYDPGSGRLLYVTDGTLVARPFDLDSLTLSGEAVPLAEDLPTFITGWTPFAVSPAGVIAHLSGRRLADFVWRDRDGRVVGRADVPSTFEAFALAPDERRVVAETDIPEKGESDLWLLDLLRGTRQRLTSLPGSESNPTWSPDGREILFINHGSVEDEKEGIYRLDVQGGGQDHLEWTDVDSWDWPLDWAPSGEMLYRRYSRDDSVDLWLASLDGEEPSPRALTTTRFREGGGRLSPDGRWVAYDSDRSQPPEIFVQRVDGTRAWAVSAGGGSAPRWSGDGASIFHLAPETGNVMRVDLELGEEPDVQPPRKLFPVPEGVVGESWEVSSDGERFLFLEKAGDPIPVTVTVGWRDALGRRD